MLAHSLRVSLGMRERSFHSSEALLGTHTGRCSFSTQAPPGGQEESFAIHANLYRWLPRSGRPQKHNADITEHLLCTGLCTEHFTSRPHFSLSAQLRRRYESYLHFDPKRLSNYPQLTHRERAPSPNTSNFSLLSQITFSETARTPSEAFTNYHRGHQRPVHVELVSTHLRTRGLEAATTGACGRRGCWLQR